MQVDALGRDYLERRNDYIAAVSLGDLLRVAARLFSGEMLVAVVGDPEGL
jgi:zinc protease